MDFMKLVMWFLLGSGVLLVLAGLWVTIHYLFSPHLENPDGKARITGSCGDTMELYLKFKRDRVMQSAYWTDGCTYSLSCVRAAADLVKGKTPDEILYVDADLIQKAIGGLPKDYMHCAKLAVETLQSALEDYMLKNNT